MAYIISVAHLPLSSILGAGISGETGGHGGGGGGGVSLDTNTNRALPPGGVNLDNAAYPASTGWMPIKTGGQPALEVYSGDSAKEALAQAWRTLRHATNAQNSYQPPFAYQSTVNMESTKKPISGGGKKDVGFRKIEVTRVKVDEDRS